MTENELRGLIRESVARALGRQVVTIGPAPARSAPQTGTPIQTPAPPWQQHPSHHLYVTLVNGGDACLIEPAVACNHCGYCQSHGH